MKKYSMDTEICFDSQQRIEWRNINIQLVHWSTRIQHKVCSRIREHETCKIGDQTSH